ncbi:MAG: glycosyltransferase [Pseudomonadota bacterium]
MIPAILHQTWKTDRIPDRFKPFEASWAAHNPNLKRILWTDRMLLEFVAEHYPEMLATYCGYPNGVMRADAARYMLLHHFGGFYADIDCECVAPLEPLLSEDRVVLCREPDLHGGDQTGFRHLPYLLFNGGMASPPGHPFWRYLLDWLPALADNKSVLDATGPCLLTSAQISFPDSQAVAVHPSSLFCPLDRAGETDPTPCSDPTGPTYMIHHWAGTWYKIDRKTPLRRKLRRRFYKLRHMATRGRILRLKETQATVDPTCLDRPAPTGGNVALLVPLRDAADLIEPFLSALDTLEYPKDKIKLVFCEGDSRDDSWQRLKKAVAPLESQYRNVTLLQMPLRTELDREKRSQRKQQRARRSGLAKVRNHLIGHGLDETDDWALWMDIDIWHYPPDILKTLIASGRRIVVPNCVTHPGGRSFDMNSFLTLPFLEDDKYWKAHRNGLFQPNRHYPERLYLSDLRHRPMVDLHGVGGTMLLVDASLHRGGLTFPEIPYRNLIETEAFGVLARDLGVTPAGLPQVEILHVPW